MNKTRKGVLKNYRRDPNPLYYKIMVYITIIFIPFFLSFMIFEGGVPMSERYHEIENIDNIFYVDAPFGRFYGDTSGSWSLFGGSVDTGPGEAYTVKYLEDGEVETIFFSSQDDHVHVRLDGDGVRVYKNYSYRHSTLGREFYRITHWYIILNGTGLVKTDG